MRKGMKSKKLILLVILVALISIVGMTSVSNANSVSGNLTSSSKFKAGESVSVVLSLSDINAGDGLRTVTVDKVNFDTNVFEAPTLSSFSGANGWQVEYSTSTQALILRTSTPVTSNGAAVTLTLKVKDGISATSGTVTFSNIVAASNTANGGDIAVGTKSITINAVSDAISSETAPTNTTNTTTQTTQAQTTTPATSSTTKTATSNTAKQTTAAKSGVSTLPKTGVGIGIAISAVVVVAIGGIFYGLYRNLKKYDM